MAVAVALGMEMEMEMDDYYIIMPYLVTSPSSFNQPNNSDTSLRWFLLSICVDYLLAGFHGEVELS